MRLGAAGRVREPSTWIALAAGHSGGSVTAEGATPLAASPLATPMNVKIAIVLAVVRRPLLRQAEWTRACVEAGIRFAGGGEASVAAPGEPAAPAPRRPETPARPVRASR